MLNKKERAVMKVIFDSCQGTGSCLISSKDIFFEVKKKLKITQREVDEVLRSLEMDDYFDIVSSDKNGEIILCVNLHLKGRSFTREILLERRVIINRLILSAIGAIATFVIGRILIFLFN